MSERDFRSAALDVGDKRIGVAVSDASSMIAQPLVVIERSGTKRDIERVEHALSSYQVSHVVIGLPVEMSGNEGRQAERVRAFANAYAEATGRTVVFQDERFTTKESERLLIASGVRRKKRLSVDQKAALVERLTSRRRAKAA